MKAVIQRVSSASVTVDDNIVGSCNEGYMILFGAAEGDTLEDIEILADRVYYMDGGKIVGGKDYE